MLKECVTTSSVPVNDEVSNQRPEKSLCVCICVVCASDTLYCIVLFYRGGQCGSAGGVGGAGDGDLSLFHIC